MPDSYTVDRKVASETLEVSLRTLDRYIRNGRLSARKINGFVRLDEDEVKSFKTGYIPRSAPEQSRIHRSLNDFEKQEGPTIDVHAEVGRILGDNVASEDKVESVYEILFKESKDELKEYQQKLEIANYRVGQLESQVQHSVPLWEHKAASRKAEARVEKIKSVAKKYLKSVKSLERQLDLEKVNSKVYIVLLVIILGLQPILWWLLQN